jgi:hypothetical protein
MQAQLFGFSSWICLVLASLGTFFGVSLGAGAEAFAQLGPISIGNPSKKYPASELLAYFGASCPSQGEWTRAALGQSEALMAALETLKNEPECKTISGTIGDLGLLNSKIAQLQSVSAEQAQLNELRSREQELLLQLSSVTDTALRSELVTMLSSVQLSLVAAQSAVETRNEYARPQQVDLLLQVVSTTEAITQQAIRHQGCLLKRPSLLPAIASLAGAVGAAVSVVNPAIGIGAAAGTVLLGQTVEYFRKAPIARGVRKISEAMAGRAYQCVLESLSTQWCRADDAERVVRLKAEARSLPLASGNLRVAVRLLDREIPALLSWLEMLRGGANPSSVADAFRQQEVYQREALVRSALPLALGVLEQARPLFDTSFDPQEKWRVQRKAINDLAALIAVQRFGPYEIKNPLPDILPEPFGRYFLVGLRESEIPSLPAGGLVPFDQFNPFTQWPARGSFSPSLELVEGQVREWIELARQRVSREMALVLQPDALRTLSEAFDPTSNPWKVSARQAAGALRLFLESRAPRQFEVSSYQKLYSDTIERLGQLERELDSVVEVPGQGPMSGPSREQQVLGGIYATMGLQYGTIFLRSRLDLAMRVALSEVFASLSESEQKVAAQVLASDRFLDVLQKVSGTDNLVLILADIQNSKPVTQETLQAFSDVFGKNLRRTLERYQERELVLRGATGASYRRSRTELCLSLLAVPAWPKRVPKELCLGLQLEPLLAGGPRSIALSEEWFRKPHEERACVYRDYLRLSKIYQDWRASGPELDRSF